MKAVVYHEFGGPLSVETVADPVPSPDGVVIQVAATGLCRSDWHGWQGHDPDIRVFPHVPGHEFAGVIVETGADVEKLQIGQRVTMPFVAGCGSCPECRAGHHQVCDHQFQPGFTAWGSFAEYVAVRYADENVVRLPDDVTDEAAASLGCRFATAYRAVVLQGRTQPGDWIAVHGCGGVGLSAVMIARAIGARPIAIDIRDEPLKLAHEFGAEATINAENLDDVPAAIFALTDRGAHVSLDALGSRVTLRNSILCLRKRGRHVQVGLLAGAEADPPAPMSRIIAWELEVVGSHGLQASRYPEVLQLVQKHPAFTQLVVRKIGLEDSPRALADLSENFLSGIGVIMPQAKTASSRLI